VSARPITRSGLAALVCASMACKSQSARRSEEAPAVTRQPLAFVSSLWEPTKNGHTDIPVCWQPASAARADFTKLSPTIRRLAVASWPVVSGVTFTGWDQCSGAELGIALRLSDTEASDADGLGRPVGGARTLTFKVTDGQLSAGLVPHLFGLALGFGKENDRTDWPSTAPARCGGAQTLGTARRAPRTAPDRSSVMATVGVDAAGNCLFGGATLSNYDAMVARSEYGWRTMWFTPLASWWNGSNDHLAAWPDDRALPTSGPSESFEGWIFTFPNLQSGTVELRLYRSGTDYATVAAGSPNEADVRALGYQPVYRPNGMIGAIFGAQQPGTVPLYQYFSASRGDYFATSSTEGVQAAKASGYELRGIEGYVFASVPYSMLGSWWSRARGDNLTTAVDSPLAETADLSSYLYSGFEAPVFKHQVQGTVPLDNFYGGSNGDHFLLANDASRSAAVSAGYYRLRTEGYARVDGSPSYGPLQSYFSAARNDHFTFVSAGARGAAAIAGYTFGQNEGYPLSQDFLVWGP
jgi:hypothetical protein